MTPRSTTVSSWISNHLGRIGLAACVLGLPLLAGACGDPFNVVDVPRMEIDVEGDVFDDDATVNLPIKIQGITTKIVKVINTGTKPLTVESIDWAKDDLGQDIKNRYVEIDWLNSVTAGSFPITIEPGVTRAFTFAVDFAPPFTALDDDSDSVLVINSTDAANDSGPPGRDITVTFTVGADSPVPTVFPRNYVFQAATPQRCERQDFRIGNDPVTATAPFRINSVQLKTSDPKWKLLNTPSDGTEVLEPNDPGYVDVVFTVEYCPTDSTPDFNSVIITTDVPLSDGGQLRVDLSSNSIVGSYSLTYDNAKEFDFTNVFTQECRNVLVTSMGPGPLKLKQPSIEDAAAREDFSWKGFKPATTPDGVDEEVGSWPQGLAAGVSRRIEVCFLPANDGTDTANGYLHLPYESPDSGEIVIPLFSGDPKSKLDIAPATGNVFVTGDAAGNQTGSANAVIYNNGNGPLAIQDITVTAGFGLEAKVFSITSGGGAQTVAPGGVHVVALAWDLTELDAGDFEQESLLVDYTNDFTETGDQRAFGLVAADVGATQAPVANPGVAADYQDAAVGQALTLSGGASTGGGGTLGAYIWYLTAKPAGSFAVLNTEETGPTVDFVADVAGSYTFELVVRAQSGDDSLLSAPSNVTVSFAAAP